ncbi:MAG TPA: secretin N-terminal domain-containing protein [Candidatus Acidoferrales bacterium]|jgi:type II secretory pathway component GspD/PulD (secretin)|nr:secretin N-terminal domain-containing protein [Candidatus Acidoferrales bacterium]
MKLKLHTVALMGMLVFQQTAMTQTTPANNVAPAQSAWPTNAITSNATATATGDQTAPAAQPAAPATTAVADASTQANGTPAVADASAQTNAAPAVAAADTNAPASGEAAGGTNAALPALAPEVVAPPTNSTLGAEAAAIAADTNAAPTIPLIQFQDVPLTVAIENLARQANINYLLDPKIGYGQPDQNGQIKAEPTLSIRWENVTAEQALLALLNNYELQLVRDPKTGIGRVTMKDPLAPPPLETRVVQLKYASVSNMVNSVTAAFTDRRSHVMPDSRTSQMIVVATDIEQDAVDTLIKELDKPTRQVLIETKLVEVASTPATSKGINWSGTVADQNVSFGNGVASASSTTTAPGTATAAPTQGGGAVPGTAPKYSTSTVINSLSQPSVLPGGFSWNTLSGLTPAIGFLNADGVQAVLSFLNSSYDAQTLSTPRVVTLDNESALISVTRMFPVINITASTAGVSSGSTSITYSNIGTTLMVTPRITANDDIWLKVVPDVSSFFATVSKVIDGNTYQADEFDMRHIETQVMIPDGNTLVMGGLVEDNPTASWTSVPVLGNIPYLGWAFKSETATMDKENLVIFITPTIVKDTDFQPATSDFLASKPMQMKEPMNPNSFWDKPGEQWSNPAPSPGEFDNTSAPQQ